MVYACVCQKCIRKLPGEHCIKNQHCAEQYGPGFFSTSPHIKMIKVIIIFQWLSLSDIFGCRTTDFV